MVHLRNILQRKYISEIYCKENTLRIILQTGLGSITIVIVIDCNRLQLERNRNCNRNQIFQIVV